MIRTCLAAAAALAASAAAAQDAAVVATKRFASLPFRETPFADVVGIHEITAGEAERRKHFRFDYDSEGRPMRVAFMQGDDVVALNDTANYYFFAPRVEFAYDGDTERRSFFDVHGNRINANGDVFEEVYALDDLGYRTRLEFLDVDGRPAANGWGVARYEWSIRDDGVVVEKRFGFDGAQVEIRGGFPFYETHFHYGPNGWLALMRNYGRDGAPTLNSLNAAQDKIEYEADGDMLGWNVLDVEGRPARGNSPGVASGVMERDAYGYETVERYLDENGAPMENAYGFGFTRSRWDAFGNRVERANYSLDGAELQVSEERGYAGYAVEFDAAGRHQVAVTFFDDNREPAVRAGRGYARIRSVVDERGAEIATRYEDRNGGLVDRADTGFAVIERDFDARGRVTEIRFVDADGGLVDHPRSGHAVERFTYGEHGVPTFVVRLDSAGGEVGP